LIEALAPSPKKPTVIEIKPAAPPAAAPATNEAAAAPQDSPAAPAPPASDEPTPEQTTVIADLHWLVHQGHVIEFADGRMDTAKKPLPKPPKPERKSTGGKPAAEGEAAATAIEPAAEIPVLTEAEIPASEPEPAVEAAPEVPSPAEAPVSASEPAAAVETAPAESAATPPVEPPAAPAIEPTTGTDETPSL
jgi:hypothetical protein